MHDTMQSKVERKEEQKFETVDEAWEHVIEAAQKRTDLDVNVIRLGRRNCSL